MNNILVKSLKTGVFYTAIARYAGIFVSVIIGAILSRLLTPKEYGLVAMVAIFITLLNILGNMGIGVGLIQNKTLSRKDEQSIFSFSLLLAASLAIIFYCSAEEIAEFFDSKELIRIIQLLTISVFLNTARVVPEALVLKKLKFRQKSIVVILSQIISGVTAILLAFANYGVYSLVAKAIADSIFLFTAYLWIVSILPALRIQWQSIKKIASYSWYQFSFNLVNFSSRNLDSLMLAKYLGASSLGYYDKAYQLMLMPAGQLTGILNPVLHPVLSNIQDERSRVFRITLIIIEFLALASFPLSVFLGLTGKEIIFFIYGPNWAESVPVFALLAFSVGPQVVLSFMGAIFQTLGETRLLMIAGTVSAILIIASIALGVFYFKSLTGLGSSLLIAHWINFFVSLWIVFRFLFQKQLNVVIKPLLPVVLITVLFYVVVNCVDNVFSLKDFSRLIQNLILLVGMLFVYIKFLPRGNRLYIYFMQR